MSDVAGELILDVKHGVVGGSDDVGCDPACEPEKGIHVLEAEGPETTRLGYRLGEYEVQS